MQSRLRICIAVSSLWLLSSGAYAAEYVFTDPAGDDNGPGNYVYPTDAVYSPGSFDLVEFKALGFDPSVELATYNSYS